ncbi:MAG: hypothetical protein Q9185_006219 [Variospora sp. 1 TL-2023]
MSNTGSSCRQDDHMYKPRKKQKIEADASTRHDAKPKFVTLEALPWNQVNLPDRLEDAGGFFGLEEISDVEVVRDENLGRVEYRLSSSAVCRTVNAPNGIEEDEWNGFDESQSEDDAHHPKPNHSPKDVEASTASASKKKLKRSTPVKLSNSNGFDVLHDDSVDEVDATLTGGLSLQKQQRILANADIIIGTPGRLWEIISSSKGLMPWLTQTKFLVLDEADRLLSQGHYKELEEILNALDRINDDDQTSTPNGSAPSSRAQRQSRQTLVFSATFAPFLQSKLSGHQRGSHSSSSTDSLTHLLLRLSFRTTPKFIDVSPLSHVPTSLSEHIVECSALEKDLYLYALLLCRFPASRALVFTNSINSVRRLVPFLKNLDLPAHALHSQMPQKARLRSVERFSASSNDQEKKEKGSILVATDVAARGLDIPNVSAVLHYHLPRAADTYVHRSGRTARKGLPGASVLICSPEEVQGMRRLVAKVHSTSVTTTDGRIAGPGIRTLELDRKIVARLKPRIVLAKNIADAGMAKKKKGHEDKWLRDAAEELGVDYDSEEFRDGGKGGKGKGQGRKKKEEKARGLSRQEVGGMKAELKAMLARRVNVGVSERYLSAGGLDVEELLEGRGRKEFLGRVGGLD